MSTNERENRRREKQRRKDKKTKQIIWIVLIIILIALMIMKVFEIDFAGIKNRLTNSDGKISITQSSSYPYTIDMLRSAKLDFSGDNLRVLSDNTYSVLNPSNAEVLYSVETGYSNPVVTYAGSYSCIIDQGGTRLRLDSNKENQYERITDNKILTADVASNGTVVYAALNDTVSTLYVLSKSENVKLELPVKDGYIISVAINSSGTKCAYATVNSNQAQLVTTVHTYNVSSEEEYASFSYKGINLYDLHYCSSNDLYVVADSIVSYIDSNDERIDIYKQDSIHTLKYAYTSDDELLLDYSVYSQAIESRLDYIDSDGDIETSIDLKQKVKYISSLSNNITVLFSDCAKVYSLSRGEEKESFTVDDSVNSAHYFSSKLFIQHGQLIDTIEK